MHNIKRQEAGAYGGDRERQETSVCDSGYEDALAHGSERGRMCAATIISPSV